MSRSKAIAVLFYLGAVVIGAALGVAADRTLVRDWLNGRQDDPQSMRDRVFADMRLTTAQRASWDSAFRDARRADSVLMVPVRLVAAPLRPQEDSIWSAMNARIRSFLTAEQRALFDKRQQDRQQGRRPRSNDVRR